MKSTATHKLTERLSASRSTLSAQLALLRRARRLYIRLVHDKIVSTVTLDYVARRMRDSGMYSNCTPPRSLRFSVLRSKWKLETGNRDWHGWCRKNGWAFYHWEKEQKAA